MNPIKKVENNKTEKYYQDSVRDRCEFIRYIESKIKDINLEAMIFNNIPETNKGDDSDIRDLLSKKIHNFKTVMDQIGAGLTYVKSGSTGHTFMGMLKNPPEDIVNNTSSFAIKVCAYPRKERYGSLYDPTRPENAELLILQHLSYFVINNHTPHIVLPICTFYSSISPFIKIHESKIVSHKRYDAFIKKYRDHDYYDNVSVLMSEWANRGDLLDFLRNSYTHMDETFWRVILFQLLSTMAIIHSKYPGFRHNDLKANNILIHKTTTKYTKYKYLINKKRFDVPNIGIQIKLWDFDFACIPGLVENSKVSASWTDVINVKPEQNRYYDIHFFFNTLRQDGFFPELLTAPEIPDSVKAFVKRVVPDHLASGEGVTVKARLVENIEYITPEELIQTDPFFEVLRIRKK